MSELRFSDYLRKAKRLEQAIGKTQTARTKLANGRGPLLCQIMPARREAEIEREARRLLRQAGELRTLRQTYFADAEVIRNADIDALPLEPVSIDAETVDQLRHMA